MKISVVIPCFNAVSSINRTLNSVKNQDYRDFECIVIDGGSTDGTLDVIHSHSDWVTKIVSEKDDGQYHAIKKGFALATGELFCWLNSDDIYFPWTFRIVNRIFSEFKYIQWISGLRAEMRDDALQGMNNIVPFPRKLIQAGWFFPGSACGCIMQESCFWTKELYRLSGGINCNWKMAADFDLWIQFSKHADLFAMPALLGAFNYTGKNRSHEDAGKAYSKEIEMIRRGISESEKSQGDWLNNKKKFSQKLFFKHPWLSLFVGEYFRETGCDGPVLGYDAGSNKYIKYNTKLYM
jgi:glycosyltransferase involved in cell wall biosynthesis